MGVTNAIPAPHARKICHVGLLQHVQKQLLQPFHGLAASEICRAIELSRPT